MISPYFCQPLLESGNYYLIACGAKYNDFMHCWVGRMSGVNGLDEDVGTFDQDKFNVAEHAKRAFDMYDGELVRARPAFDQSRINVALDHFGRDILILPSRDG